jgi:hypothetical protein
MTDDDTDGFALEDDGDDEPPEDLAEDTSEVACPYCGEIVEIALDAGGGTHQEYVEDCQVCCRPWKVKVNYGRDGVANVTIEADDEEDPAE